MRYQSRSVAAWISLLFLAGVVACGDVLAGEESPALNTSIDALSNRQPHVEAEVEALVRKLFEFNANKNLEGMSYIL